MQPLQFLRQTLTGWGDRIGSRSVRPGAEWRTESGEAVCRVRRSPPALWLSLPDQVLDNFIQCPTI